MVKIGDKAFREVALIDAEYTARAGEHVKVICIVVKLLCKGEVHRLWLDGVCKLKTFPVPFDRDVLFVCYSALAELSAIQSLGLPPFVSILDLFAEYRVLTNERISPGKTGLLSACEFFGVSTITASYKHDNRAIAIRGSPFTDEERASLLDYCQEDVEALERLLPTCCRTSTLAVLSSGASACARLHVSSTPGSRSMSRC